MWIPGLISGIGGLFGSIFQSAQQEKARKQQAEQFERQYQLQLKQYEDSKAELQRQIAKEQKTTQANEDALKDIFGSNPNQQQPQQPQQQEVVEVEEKKKFIPNMV